MVVAEERAIIEELASKTKVSVMVQHKLMAIMAQTWNLENRE